MSRRTPGSWARACHEDQGLLGPWSDWYEDRGDLRRAGAVRWLARAGRWPFLAFTDTYDWWREGWFVADQEPHHSDLPRALWDALAGGAPTHSACREYRTPEAAVLDLLRVWTPERARGEPCRPPS
jgi:hypothetical protein